MNLQPGQLIQSPFNPIFPATQLTGPITAGNIKDWDGSNVLAGLGSTAGALANVGYARMVQVGRITQATNGGAAGVFTSPDLIIPAQSLITSIDVLTLVAFTGAASTFGIGNTASATAYTAAGALTAAAAGAAVSTAIGSAAAAAGVANWVNVGNQDVQLVFTSTNTGAGVALAIVGYIQGLNAPTS